MTRFLTAILLFSLPVFVTAQVVEVPTSNSAIYSFIDELANMGVIDLNSVVKPYSRSFIAQCLEKANANRELLTARMERELLFYLRDFSKEDAESGWVEGRWVSLSRNDGAGDGADLFYYKDSLFTLTVNPLVGGTVRHNSSGVQTYWYNGAEAWAYIGKWGFYGALTDNHENPLGRDDQYLAMGYNGQIKGGTDWSEMRAGVTYDWGWGDAGLVNSTPQWGNNYNGANILGGNTPAYVQLKLHINPVEWFDFNYIHAKLVSEVVDSTRSYWVTGPYGTDYREVKHNKYMAASIFSLRPLPRLWVSVGSSIIYSGQGMEPLYFIPVMFFRSGDQNLSQGIDDMNSQLFLDISSRQVKNLHLYGTLFIDELSLKRFSDPDRLNFFSYKAGARVVNIPVDNLGITAEYTLTYPLTFRHYVPTLTFTSNLYNMGHYLKDNAREWYLAVDYRPFRASEVKLFFSDAIRGPDYTDLGIPERDGNPYMESVEWHNRTMGLSLSWQPLNNIWLNAAFIHSEISGNPDWSPEYYYGTKNTVSIGAGIGFGSW